LTVGAGPKLKCSEPRYRRPEQHLLIFWRLFGELNSDRRGSLAVGGAVPLPALIDEAGDWRMTGPVGTPLERRPCDSAQQRTP
jgi:hypothetical protein